MRRLEQLDILTVASNQVDKEYWMEELSGVSAERYLERDVKKVHRSVQNELFYFHAIKRSLSKKIFQLCNESDYSLHTLLVSVVGILLHKYSGSEDVLVATPIYKQHKSPDANLINTLLAIRTTVSQEDSFKNVLTQARDKIKKAVRHQNYPYEILDKELRNGRDEDQVPLLSIAVVLDTIQHQQYLRDIHFDITFIFSHHEGKISCKVLFDSALYSTASIERYLQQFNVLLEQLIDQPAAPLSSISLLTPEENYLIRTKFNDTARTYDNADIPVSLLIEKQVKQHADKIAIHYNNGQLSFAEWNRRANRLASFLRSRGAGRNTIIPIIAERSPEMMVGILAIIKAGAAYLPVDPSLPADRIQFMLADSKAKLVLKQSQFELAANEDQFEIFELEDQRCYTGDGSDLSCINQPGDLAYVIYTSGSTGTPKGVMIEHASLVNRLNWMQRRYPLVGTDLILHKTPFTFDVSVWELFWWALTGTSVCLLKPGAEKYCDQLVEVIAGRQVTVLHFVPSMFAVFLDYVEETNSAPKLRSLRQVFTSGEALTSASVKQFNKLLPWCELSNLYGPTEATIDVSFYDCPKNNVPDSIPIGKPIDNTGLFITDKHLQLQPIGVAGELCISGTGLARGYLNREELTHEKFVKVNWQNGLVYRTGDLARWLPDGNIEYLGRMDHQVKIRGYRIELGEIEHCLLQQQLIKEALVVAKQRGENESYLCAYIVVHQPLAEEAIKEELAKTLPAYMIPHYIITLDKMPLSSNGKVNRKVLPEPTRLRPLNGNTVTDISPQKQKLAAIWKEVLKTEQLSMEDNFFSVGGDSILAIRLISKVNKTFSVSVSLAAFYDAQTFGELAELLIQEMQKGTEKADPVIEQEISDFASAYLSSLSDAQKQRVEDVYPMSSIEKGMCYHHLLDNESSIYFEQNTLDFRYHEIDTSRMCQAIQLLVNKHPILRTGYDLDRLAHIVYKEIPLPVSIVDVSDKERSEQREYIQHFLNESRYKPFDVNDPPLWRVTLFFISEAHMVICMESHHAILDGWSWASMVTEMNNIYFQLKKEPDFVPQRLQSGFREFIADELRTIRDNAVIKFWKNELEGYRRLQLPKSQGPFTYCREQKKYEKQYLKDLKATCDRHGIQLKELFFAAYVYALKMLTYENDILVGLVSFNRPITEDGEKMLGCYLNTVPVRIKIPPHITWKDYLLLVAEKLAAIRQHDQLPLMEIIRHAGESSNGGNLLFDAHFNFINFHVWDELSSDDSLQSDAKPFRFENFLRGNILLDFNVDTTGDSLTIGSECFTEFISEYDFKRFFHYYEVILQAMANGADSLINHDVLLGEEAQRVHKVFNATEKIYEEAAKPLNRFIDEQMRSKPDSVAIVYGNECLTYDELKTKAGRLAAVLQSAGAERNKVVAILAERSPEFIIAVLAILRSGAAFLPIDPSYPVERIQYILKDSGAQCLLCQKKYVPASITSLLPVLDIKDTLASAPDVMNDTVVNEETDLAYIIYTSGSTGNPKGVMIQHRSLMNYLLTSIADYSGPHASSSYLHLSVAFDASLTALFVPLMMGKLTVISSNKAAEAFEDENFFRYAPYDFIKLTPAHFSLLEEALSRRSEVKKITDKYVVGGEALLLNHIRFLIDKKEEVEIFNEYGPTEATVGCCTYRFTPTGEILSSNGIIIGKPMTNVKLYVLDKRFQQLPVGVMGELFIGGVQLAQRYLNQEELNKEKFINDPFNTASDKLYRTGDLACWREDGNLQYAGRTDDQVKINGYRVEIGEIESVLNDSKLVVESVVTVRKDETGNKRLIGYIVSETATVEQVRLYLQQKLPEYMVPTLWVKLVRLPLTQHGKVDRLSLPDPLTGDVISKEYVEPATATEQDLAAIWKEVLKVDRIGVTDNFFDLGGHSLLAIRIVSAIRRKMETELVIRDLFVHPSVRQLASFIESRNKKAVLPAIQATSTNSNIPLSFGQERLWFIDQLEGSLQYHIPMVARLKGEINKQALNRSIQTIINRHQVLRTVIRQKDGYAYQHILEKDAWQLDIIDTANEQKDDTEWQQFIQSLVDAPFDLSADHTLRAHLIAVDRDDHILVLNMHHISSDDLSIAVLMKELKECYSAFLEDREPVLTPLPVQYKDYAAWQRKYIDGEVLQNKVAYWKQQLEGVEPLMMPTDHPRPSVQTTRGASLKFKIDEKLGEQLNALSRKQGCTLFMTLLSAYKTLLHRYTGQEDICVGSAITGRTYQELEGLIGFFVNTLALRSNVSDNPSFINFLQQIKETTLNAYEHQDVPFEAVVEAVVKERDLSRHPLFQVMFIVRNNKDAEDDPHFLKGLTIAQQHFAHKSSKFDTTFLIVEKPDGLEGRVEYCTDLFDRSTINAMIKHYLQLLRSIVENPDEKIDLLEIIDKEEKQVLFNYNDTAADYPSQKTVIDLFNEQVASSPDATAFITGITQITYKELDEWSSQFCRYLQSFGVKKGDFVPLCIQRSAEMMIALWGIIKSGAAYVPVDPGFPADRIAYILKDTAAQVVVCNSQFRSRIALPDSCRIIEIDKEEDTIVQYDFQPVQVVADPAQVAYVIYTSGSTGTPKGVMIEHGSLVNRLNWMQRYYPLSGNDVILHKTPFTFDVSVWELFWWAITGTSVCLLEPGAEKYCDRLIEVIEEIQVTVLHFVPSMFVAFLDHVEETDNAEKLQSLRQVFTSGEALSSASVKQFNKLLPWCKLSNLYGPTEATIDVSYYDCPKTNVPDSIPIGKPIDNTGLFIINKHLQLQPQGVPGELCISGVNLARGYLNREELTREKFVKVGWLQGLVYRTGDLARLLPDGNIEYLGRLDDQVKIRGYRIELGEIENVIQNSGLVKQCAVVTKPDSTGNQSIIAYTVMTGSASRNELLSRIKEKLPEYMVPSVMMVVDQIPVTKNGKMDKKSLPDPVTSDVLLNAYEPPRNETEQVLAAIWQNMLEIDKLGVFDNFFESGGHSLMIPVLISSIRKQLKVNLVVRDLFTCPTIDKLAALIKERVR